MNNQHILFNLIIIVIIFSHCSKNINDGILANYDGGQLTKSELIDRIGKKRFKKIIDSNALSVIVQKSSIKKIIFDESEELIYDKNINNEVQKVANDIKLKKVLDHLVNNYLLNDSIINFIYTSENTKYTIQDIVVTHRLTYSQHEDRAPKEAYAIAKIVRERIDSKQLSFDEAVSVYAEHPSVKLRNGIMGPLPYGKLPKEFNDIIWRSMPGDIIGPVETKFGYHIFQTIKKENVENSKQANRKKAIKKEIKSGKYGFLDEYTDLLADEWFRMYGGEIYIDNIDTLWNIADSIGLFIIPNGISMLNLDKTGYQKPLAKINGQNLSIDWFIEEIKRQGRYKKTSLVKAYFLYNTLKDILHRYSAIIWFENNNTIFDHQKTYKSIKIKQENYLFDKYMSQEIDKDSSLTNSVILNRLAIRYNLEIMDGAK